MQRTGTPTRDIWTYSETVRTGGDLSGYHVEATDGSIGKIDEATYDEGSSCLVVDTGPWIFGKKVLLPAGIVESVDHDDAEGLRQPNEGRDRERAGLQRRPVHRREVPRRARAVLRRPRTDDLNAARAAGGQACAGRRRRARNSATQAAHRRPSQRGVSTT